MKKKGQGDSAAVVESGYDTDTKTKPKSEGASGIGKFLVSGLVFMVIILVAGIGVLGWLQFARQQALNDATLAEVVATQQATLINEQVGFARNLASRIAASELIDTSDEAVAAASATRVSDALPGANIQVIAAGQLLLPETLSFSAREVVQKARASSEPVVTVLPGNPPMIHVGVATPDKGVVLLTWKMDRIKTLMETQNRTGAKVMVMLGNASLFAVGEASNGQAHSASADADITVSVTVPPRANDPALLVLFGAIAGGMLLLVLLVMSSTLLAINRGLRKDSALLVHLAHDLATNPSAKPREKFTFNVLELVTGSLRKLAGRASAIAARGAAPGRTRPDDIAAVLQDEDHDLLVVDDRNEPTVPGVELPPEIFRDYDIRGVVGKNLTRENVELIGRAIGTEALAAGQQTVIVARDGRLSGPDLSRALIAGITASGRNVIDLGMVPTPVLYYATKVLGSQSGVCLTGSHNPPNENGLKVVINGETLHGERIQALRERIARGDFSSGKGTVQEQEVASRYLNEIVNDIVLARPMKVAIDTANGVTGKLAPELLRQLGCEVVELFTEIDGNFPNHSPDTSKPDNYKALIEAVQSQQAEIGIALDGDGDRIGVVTPKGEIIWADRLMMLFARDLLNRTPGADIIFDVKCSRELAKLVSQHGGRPLMWKTGHSLIKAKLKEVGAPLAGEMSGHIFFNDRWHGFDDGMYAMTRLLEILSLESADADAVFAGLKTGVTTPEISIPVTDQSKFPLIEKLQAKADEFSDGSAVTIDGLRVDFEDGWGLVRASNTGPTLVARFEGSNDAALARIKDQFKQQLLAINPQLRLPF